jgi:hypothetical protein
MACSMMRPRSSSISMGCLATGELAQNTTSSDPGFTTAGIAKNGMRKTGTLSVCCSSRSHGTRLRVPDGCASSSQSAAAGSSRPASCAFSRIARSSGSRKPGSP